MTALTRAWTLPMRALLILVTMILLAAVTQLLGAGQHPRAPAQQPPADAGAGLPRTAPADLDSGTGATTGDPADLVRINADIAFWSSRFQKNRLDFVSANQWGLNEIALGRETGDVTAYLRANAAFEASIGTFAANPGAIDAKAGVLVSLHRFEQARDLASTELVKYPGDQTALATLGDAKLELGDVAGARAAYDNAVALGSSAALLVREGHLAFIVGDTRTALADSRAAVAAGDQEGAEGERAAFYRYQLGDTLISTGDRAGAQAAYADALRQDPRSFLALSGLARVAAANGDLTEAISLLSNAIAVVPQPEFAARRADLYVLRNATGDQKRAADDMATVQAIAQLAGEAANVYDRALSLYLANHGLEPARALSLAQNELTGRKDIYGYDAAAWALLAAGQASDADAMMAKALAFGTRDAKLLYHAGMIAAAVGDRGRAIDALRASLALDPSFDAFQAERARRTLAGL